MSFINSYLHCTSALVCIEVTSFLRKWKQLVLLNCLIVCPGTMRWLNCALVNSVWLTAVIKSENCQHYRHKGEVQLWSGYYNIGDWLRTEKLSNYQCPAITHVYIHKFIYWTPLKCRDINICEE
jgi:hypothetical protein